MNSINYLKYWWGSFHNAMGMSVIKKDENDIEITANKSS